MKSKSQIYKEKKLHEFLSAWHREFSTEWVHRDDAVSFDLFEAVGYKGLWWYLMNKTSYMDDKQINAGKFFRLTRDGLWFINKEGEINEL